MADSMIERNIPSVDNEDEDTDIIELRNLLSKLGFNVAINSKNLEKICYENIPQDSRLELLQNVLFRIHPEKEFWRAKNDAETKSNILKVASWFGLAPTDNIVMGGGTRTEQKQFWLCLLQTAAMLENSECLERFVPIDVGVIKHLDFIILNSNILEEMAACSKGVETTGDNSSANLVASLINKIEAETSDIESQLDEVRKRQGVNSGYKSAKLLKRKHQLSNALKTVQKNISALLDKYKVLCPVSGSAITDNGNIACEILNMKETFQKIVQLQCKLQTFNHD